MVAVLLVPLEQTTQKRLVRIFPGSSRSITFCRFIGKVIWACLLLRGPPLVGGFKGTLKGKTPFLGGSLNDDTPICFQ